LTAPAPVAPALLAPAREPYMTPPPPQPRPVIGEDEDESPWQDQPPAPSSPERPTPTARLQRSLMLLGMFGLVVAGFALAPYLSIVAIGALVLGVRTLSWVSEAQRDRRLRRGPRWYDGTLALLSTPWYLLVAAGGTLMLLLWAAGIAFVTGIGALLFRPPVQTGLLVMGAVLAVALWWGPGSRRLRRSARELIGGVTRSAAAGWLMVALVAAGFALTTFTLLGNGTIWAPQPGPPWREGTLLADLLGFVSI
jgi:Flp pilus assembly protein TadB